MNQEEYQRYYIQWAHKVNNEIVLLQRSLQMLSHSLDTLINIVEINERRLDRIIFNKKIGDNNGKESL